MSYLTYNGPDNGKNSSSMIFLLAGFLIIFIAMPYFSPKQEQGQENDKASKQETVAQENVPVTVRYAIEPRTLETDEYTLTMTNAGGGRVSSFMIKDPERYLKHGDFIRSQKPAVDSQGGILPLEMTLPQFQIGPETQFQIVSESSDKQKISFSYATLDNQYQFVKTFTTTDKPYVVHAKLELTNRSTQALADNLAISMFIKQIEGEEPGLFTPGSYVASKCYSDGDMEYLDFTDKDEHETYQRALKWFGVDESYFAMAMTANYGSSCVLRNDDGLLKSTLNIPVVIQPNTTAVYDFDIYMGPKEATYLDVWGEDANLPAIIDYGFMEVLAKPMAWILDVFHKWTGNWGLAIILLTLIVRGLLWPVAQKSQVSMMRMSKIAPLMQEIQEKYKDDPAMMQQKQLELYQTHKINPFGCLPLLLQMPIFFALYRCIFVTGGLYNAEFVFWIKDLSAPDPYFILPILSVVLLVVQQLLTPSTVKNTSQKVMIYSMPVIFGLMMLFLPSGLCLYMIVSSGIGMVQSFYVRRVIAREEAEEEEEKKNDTIIENLGSKERRAAKRREEKV